MSARVTGEVKIPPVIWISQGIQPPVLEYLFALPRKWRIDYAWPAERLAVEIEGGYWRGGRHTRGTGFEADMVKYNALTDYGWRLLRYPPPGKHGYGVDFEQIKRVLDCRI